MHAILAFIRDQTCAFFLNFATKSELAIENFCTLCSAPTAPQNHPARLPACSINYLHMFFAKIVGMCL